MSDLDDDLLALAGGAGDSGEESEADYEPTFNKRSRDEEDGGDNEDEDEDDDELLSKKKRRTDASDLEFDEDEDDDEAEEDEGLVNPYPLEGKYKDASDRDRLESMDEIQREQILFDRTQEMERFNEKKYLQQRMKQQKKLQKQQSETSKPTRSSNRAKGSTVKTSKLDKLSELRKQREQKSRKKVDDYDDDGEEEDDDDDELRDDDEEEEEEYDDGVVTWGGASKSKPKRSNERASLDAINKIKLGRTLLSKYCFYAGFNDVIIDSFARINLGIDKRTRNPMYRMVKVVDVRSIPERAYKLTTFKCDLYIKVSQNRKQTKEFPINIFSDSPITSGELEIYSHELNKTGETIDYLDDVTEKYNQIQAFINKGVSDKDVNEMIEKKRKLQESRKNEAELSGFDAVFRKAKLMDELKIARQQGDSRKSSAIIEKLKAIEKVVVSRAQSSTSTDSKNGMSKVNERNRKLNSTNIRKAEIKTKNAGTVFDGGDPFSRLKTVTRMFYQNLTQEENEKALQDAKLNLSQKLAEKSKQEEKIAQSSYRILGEMDKLIQGLDIDIDIDIEI